MGDPLGNFPGACEYIQKDPCWFVRTFVEPGGLQIQIFCVDLMNLDLRQTWFLDKFLGQFSIVQKYIVTITLKLSLLCRRAQTASHNQPKYHYKF